MDASHPIFNTPDKVELVYEEIDTPDHYARYPEGPALGKKLKVWRVHGKLRAKDYGLVSDGYGFDDSPDCEYISGGVNSKGPRSVALGRQGNFFLWGFSAPPGDMTDQAKRVFVNTLVYMKQFDGQRPLGQKAGRARGWAYVFAHWLGDDHLSQYAKKSFGARELEESGGDPKKMAALLKRHDGFLRHDNGWTIDRDALALGLANRDPALLERCVSLLEKGEDRERALRLLRRYTGEEHGDAKAWRRWFEARKDRLYFTDTGGFVFKARSRRSSR
ncbi:MAG: hypothetical protein CMJ83_11960 [Planctomycetes bacterium]|nr:hypothetical protein [Planctomycetota bacterium]